MGAWAASPGLLGRLPGAPRGGVPAESLQAVGGRASRGFASKIMTILMSIFGRLGVHLGSLLEVMLGSCWRFVPSGSRTRLRTALSSKKRCFTKQLVFEYLFPLIDPKIRPRLTQDRAKIGPRSFWIAFFIHLECSSHTSGSFPDIFCPFS